MINGIEGLSSIMVSEFNFSQITIEPIQGKTGDMMQPVVYVPRFSVYKHFLPFHG